MCPDAKPASPRTVWAKLVESRANSTAADEQATRKSNDFRGRLQKTRMGTPAFRRDTGVPLLKRRCRFKFGVCPTRRKKNGLRRFRGVRGPGGFKARPCFRFHRWRFCRSPVSAACLPSPMNGAVSPQKEKKKSNTSSGR